MDYTLLQQQIKNQYNSKGLKDHILEIFEPELSDDELIWRLYQKLGVLSPMINLLRDAPEETQWIIDLDRIARMNLKLDSILRQIRKVRSKYKYFN